MAEKFKKHMMYGDGKSKMANTKKQHLNLKAKGWGHTKPKSNSPLDLNQTLVQGAGISNKQYGGATSLSAGEWRGDLMTKPILDAMIGKKLTEEEQKAADAKKKLKENKEKVTKKDSGYEEYLKDNPDGLVDGDEGVLSEEDWKELNEQNTETKKTKKGPKEVKVERKRGNVFGKLFNPKRYNDGDKYTESNKTRRALLKEMKQAKKEFGKDSQEFKDLEKRRDAKLYRVKRKGLFNDKTLDDAELTDFFENEGITDTGPRGRTGRRTGKYYSPLDMNSREKYFSKKTKRKNSQGNSPYAYKERVDDNTPFYQVEEVSTGSRKPEQPLQGGMKDEVQIEGNAFDLMEKYGKIDAKKYGSTLNLIGDEKPPQLLGRSASIAIDDFMKVQKDALYKAKTSKKGTSEQTAIIYN